MEVLSNIPNAILNNIGFMAILFMVYECVKWMGNLKPAKLFLFAGAIQVISLLQFISSIFAANTFSLFEMTAKIANFTIPLNNNNNIQWLTVIGLTYCIILIYFLARILIQFKYIAGLKKTANFTQSDFLTSSLPPQILKNKSNIIKQLPPAEEGPGARVGYYRSDPNLLFFSIPTNENILY